MKVLAGFGVVVQMYSDKWDGHLPSTLANGQGNAILAPFQGK